MLMLVLQVLLLPIFIVKVWRTRYRSRAAWLTEVILFGLIFVFASLVVRWDIITYYLRYLLPTVYAVACLVSYRRIEPSAETQSPNKKTVENVLNALIILGMIWFNINALASWSYPAERAINLAYPLKDAVYYVGGGGSNQWTNGHSIVSPQDYALDILQINGSGMVSDLMAEITDLSGYEIFGATIYSPCDGIILRAVNDKPDQIPPNMDSVNLAGNYVLIACHDVELLLAHMMEGSVLVNEGDAVATGDVLGQVGNSGQSTEPHLHIHAEKGGIPGNILDGEGVPIVFEGRFLVRNNLFTGIP